METSKDQNSMDIHTYVSERLNLSWCNTSFIKWTNKDFKRIKAHKAFANPILTASLVDCMKDAVRIGIANALVHI